MSITFGGLATGMDTDSIITKLMSLERAPINRLQADKKWMNNRLAAFNEFNDKLTALRDAAKELSDDEGLLANEADTDTGKYLKASASGDAIPGTSYEVEVLSLATVQKSVSDTGFASKTTSLGTGTLRFLVDGTEKTVEITSGNDTLESIVETINESDIGLQAAIINDGSESPYRLVLTGENVAKDFEINPAPAQAGDLDLGTFTVTQAAATAQIKVDNIVISGESNTITDAIPGVTLDLVAADSAEKTKITIKRDSGALTAKLEAFVSAYNDAVSFVTSQSKIDGSSGGVLGGDAGLNSIKRHLQDMLTEFSGTGSFQALAQLGLETQKDGTLVLDSTTLTNAMDKDISSVISLLAGKDGSRGIMDQFEDYLDGMTSSTTGFLAGRKNGITSNIKRIDTQIEQMEARLEKREKTLRDQFTAMEQLVSVMNTQSNFLYSQLTAISQLGRK